MNRRGFLNLLLLVLLAGLLQAEAANPDLMVRAAEGRRFAAMMRADAAELAGYLAEDLTYTHSNGVTENREQFLKSIASGKIRYRSIEPLDVQARLYGDTAVLTGLARLAVTSEGKDFELKIRFTSVCVRQEGSWRLAAWQSTRAAE